MVLEGSLQGKCGVLGSIPTHATESDRWGLGLGGVQGRQADGEPIQRSEAAQGLMHSGCYSPKAPGPHSLSAGLQEFGHLLQGVSSSTKGSPPCPQDPRGGQRSRGRSGCPSHPGWWPLRPSLPRRPDNELSAWTPRLTDKAPHHLPWYCLVPHGYRAVLCPAFQGDPLPPSCSPQVGTPDL